MPKPGNPRLPVAFILGSEADLPGPASHPLAPLVDVVETSSGWRLVFEIPGAVPERTSIEVKERIVVVRGERRRTEGEGGVFLRLERVTGPFERALELPEDADADRTTAFYQDGLLILDVPKRAATRGRSIPIRRGESESA
jgi:HSP20 family protein